MEPPVASLSLSPAAVAADLAAAGLAGWLLADFRGSNPTAVAALGLADALLTRRWALWLPAEGEPTLLVSAIESAGLPPLPARVEPYLGHAGWRAALARLVGGRTVAVEWHPGGEIPYLSRLDAGLADLLRELGATLVSSAALAQRHLALWDAPRLASHRRSAAALTEIVEAIFSRLSATAPGAVDEAGVQGWIMAAFAERGLVTDHPPIVAVDSHAGNPHHVPAATGSRKLGKRFLLLVDLWAGEHGPEGAFADITWMARRGPVAPEADKAFLAILAARDAAVAALESAWAEGRILPGCEVDDACREVVAAAGFGECFTHRTGHSLGIGTAHGDGANLDGFEARDPRPVEPGLAVTIEPGIYTEGWGVRTEINLAMAPGPQVTTPPQRGWVEV